LLVAFFIVGPAGTEFPAFSVPRDVAISCCGMGFEHVWTVLQW